MKTKPKPKSKKKGKQEKGQEAKPALTLKEQLALKRQKNKARKAFLSSILSSLSIGLLLGLPVFALSPKLGLAVTAGIPALIFSYRFPYQALWLFLIYMPFSGTVTYWLAGGNAIFQLAKDAFYIPALIALVKECKKKRLPILVNKPLMSSLWVVFISSLMTLFLVNGLKQVMPGHEGLPFFQGLLGLKVFLGYVPLIFCAFYLIKDIKTLLFLGRLLVVLAIVCCVLGIIQYWLLDSGRCHGTRDAVGDDLFKATLDAKCLVGGSLTFSPSQNMIRLPGTFVSPWHWAWFLISNSALTYTTAFNDTSPLWKILGLIGMALVMVNAVISGQRIALALVPVVIIILLILTGQVANLKKFLPIGLGLGMILIGVMVSNPALVQERLDSFVSRWQAAPPTAFIQDQMMWAWKNQAGFLGRGLGVATNSTRIFGETSLVETYHPKLLFEVGIMGLTTYMIFLTHLTWLTFKTYRSIKNKVLRSFGSSFWVFILIISYFPYWYPLDTDPVAVYYWLLAGIIFKLPELDKEEEKKLKMAES